MSSSSRSGRAGSRSPRRPLLPDYSWAGWRNYTAVLASRNWTIAFDNLLIYGACFVLLTSAVGLLLAVLLDQRIRGENVLRTIFLYPMAVSFVVTGTVWAWLLNPRLGIEKLVTGLGWTGFRFDWLVDRDMAIYTVVIAAACRRRASRWRCSSPASARSMAI